MVLKYIKISSLNRIFSANFVLIRITLSENGFLETKMNGDNQVSVLCLSYSEVSDYAAKFWILESAGSVFLNRRFDNILLFRFVSIMYATEIS